MEYVGVILGQWKREWKLLKQNGCYIGIRCSVGVILAMEKKMETII